MAGGVEKYKTKVSVSFDGNNTWMAPAMFQSICDIDIQYFPFDEQKCHLKFASWAYDVSKLDVFLNDKETGRLEGIYQPSNEWILLRVDAERNEVSWTETTLLKLETHLCCVGHTTVNLIKGI